MEVEAVVEFTDGTREVYPASDVIDAEEICDRIRMACGNQVKWAGICHVTYDQWMADHYRDR